MKKLAIVGAEPLTRNNAPFNDEDYDIWAISNWANADWMLRCSAVIEVHKPKLYMNHPKDAEYWNWLQNTDIPVYMQDIDSNVKASVKYPLDDVLDLVGSLKIYDEEARPLNSSIAYAIGLALLQGYKEIDIYGVEMSNSSEYRSQQPMFTFWVGVAAGMGATININCTQALFVQPLYGYEDMMNNEKIHSYINGLKDQLESAKKQEYMIEGALQVCRQLLEE